VSFASESKLSRIEKSAFEGCSSLSSICIPSSVEILCEKCFCYCASLSNLTFESESKLSRIGESAFRHCSSLPWTFLRSSQVNSRFDESDPSDAPEDFCESDVSDAEEDE
jgi:hypothetical protein